MKLFIFAIIVLLNNAVGAAEPSEKKRAVATPKTNSRSSKKRHAVSRPAPANASQDTSNLGIFVIAGAGKEKFKFTNEAGTSRLMEEDHYLLGSGISFRWTERVVVEFGVAQARARLSSKSDGLSGDVSILTIMATSKWYLFEGGDGSYLRVGGAHRQLLGETTGANKKLELAGNEFASYLGAGYSHRTGQWLISPEMGLIGQQLFGSLRLEYWH